MKKLLVLIVALAATATMFAQTNVPVKLPVNMFIWEYTGVSADKVDSTATTWVKPIQLNKLDGLFYNAKVKVADGTANATCKIYLKGKLFADDTYTIIDSLQWKGTGTDTTFRFTQNTNKIYYRYLTFELKQVANTTKVISISLSVKK